MGASVTLGSRHTFLLCTYVFSHQCSQTEFFSWHLVGMVFFDCPSSQPRFEARAKRGAWVRVVTSCLLTRHFGKVNKWESEHMRKMDKWESWANGKSGVMVTASQLCLEVKCYSTKYRIARKVILLLYDLCWNAPPQRAWYAFESVWFKIFSKGTDFDQFGLKWVCFTYRPEIRHKRVLS